MRDQNGSFYAAEDVDIEGVEGEFYFWNKKEIKDILTEKEYKEFFKVFNGQQQEKVDFLSAKILSVGREPEI